MLLPSNSVLKLINGFSAGPFNTLPLKSNSEPWQGQSRKFLLLINSQPRCVQIGFRALKLPLSCLIKIILEPVSPTSRNTVSPDFLSLFAISYFIVPSGEGITVDDSIPAEQPVKFSTTGSRIIPPDKSAAFLRKSFLEIFTL